MSLFIAEPSIASLSVRENAAVPGGADDHRPSVATLIPMAIVAAVVLAPALLVSGTGIDTTRHDIRLTCPVVILPWFRGAY
jgi:hypothetical protein